MKIQCRCGAVEIEISAEPIVQFFCHCDDCQAVHGGALRRIRLSADAVKVVRGDPTTWKLKRNPRFTCRECGTRLFIDVELVGAAGRQRISAPAGGISSRLSHALPVRRPARRRRPSALQGHAQLFGGSDETVEW